MTRRLWWLLLVLAALFWKSAAADPVRIEAHGEHYRLNAAASVLEDPSGRLGLAAVKTDDVARRFRPQGGELSSFGFTDSAYWFRITLENPAPEPRPMLLVLRTNWLDSIQVFGPGDTDTSARQFGDTLPFKTRSHDSPQFVIDLALAPGTHTYYLRVTSAQAFMTPIELWPPDAFHESDRLWSAYYGLFYGILFVMVLYNGFIWVSTRDRNYLFYCLYLVAFFLMNFSYNGFSYQYFWPESPRWSNWTHTHWIFLFQFVALLFAMNFLESKDRLPRVHRILRGFVGLMLAAWLSVTLVDNAVAYNAAPVYFIFVCTPLILASGVFAWRGGYRAARFFVLASMTSLVGSFFTALTVSGLLPYTFANFHAAEFGIMADVVLLSLALADRIKLLAEQRQAAEQNAIAHRLEASAMLKQANEDLERTVRERTAELARARDEAERLARTDVLTGVANRRYFEEVATQEFARARRYGQPLSVIVFDIDFFKQINDNHGHAAGDAVIRAVANIAHEAVREVDFVARVGGEEFAILLPGVRSEHALVSAERLRERIAHHTLDFQGSPLSFTASFGISQIAVIDPGFGNLQQRADHALYAAKQAGRNRVASFAAAARGRMGAAPDADPDDASQHGVTSPSPP
ncbi:7TM diverse intracellular signaling domain-containing protein [Niveibacterium sp. SC-1]|uniref:sensor domain-containing diguanylate cyclase n=1 Tax=Niveibacterium sp. SC-1 TaxID=3135646 RepID=UPI00311F4CD7